VEPGSREFESGCRAHRDNDEATDLGFTGTHSVIVRGPADSATFQTIPTLDQIEAAIREVQ
jgi:hypothetical protein